MKCKSLILIILFLNLKLFAQKVEIEFKDVSKSNIIKIVDTLSSEYFEGRDIESSEKILRFISEEYNKLGLESLIKNDFIQKIEPFKYLNYSNESYLKLNENYLTIHKDFIHSLFDLKEKFNKTEGEINSKLFFAGLPNMNTEELLKDQNLKGKTVIFFEKSGINVHEICQQKGAIAIIKITNNTDQFLKQERIELQMAELIKIQNFHIDSTPRKPFITLYLSPSAGAKLLGIKESKLKKYSESYNQIKDSTIYKLPEEFAINIYRKKEFYKTGNIIGFIQGKNQTTEHIIVSAHFDHLGKTDDSYYPGANDNASGISSMLEIARILSSSFYNGIIPERSILFIAFGMEETHMLGSKYYVDHPLLPLENLKANINIDMVGRQDKYHDSIPNYIYALGPDSLGIEIKHLMDSINNIHKFTKLEFLEEYPNANKFFSQSSDQVNFLRKGIPAVLINNGMHPDLHQTTDTKDKLNYHTIENVTKLLILSIWELANRP